MFACYLRLIRAGFRRYSTYWQAVVAGLATNVVFGFMRCAVLLTVFASSAQVAGYDPSATVTFVWIGQGLIAVVLIWGNTDFGERVRSGDIAVDLPVRWTCRPRCWPRIWAGPASRCWPGSLFRC